MSAAIVARASRSARSLPPSRQAVVRALCEANLESLDGFSEHELPSRELLSAILWELRSALFPLHFGARCRSPHGLSDHVRRVLNAALGALEDQIRLGLLFDAACRRMPAPDCDGRAAELTEKFAARLPQVRAWLGQDVRAAGEDGPASDLDEAIVCYPGVVAILHHRLAHELQLLGVPLVPRLIAELSRASTGIEIHPSAHIGAGFCIAHGAGVVIGETSVIAPHVRLYQGVTLGAGPLQRGALPHAGTRSRRHPLIEENVVVHAGSVLVGRISVGRGSVIGSNVWLTESVAPGSRVFSPRRQRPQLDSGAES